VKLYISETVRCDEKWFPILDSILLIVAQLRFTFAVDDVSNLLASEWVRSRKKIVAEIIMHSCQASSTDSLRHKASIIIDDDVRRGGVCDRDALRTKIHPLDAIIFLSTPYQIIVENEEFDGAFIFWMAKALGFDKLNRAYRDGHFCFRHAGGKDSIARSGRIFKFGVWARADEGYARAFDHWLCAILDKDAKFPGDTPNKKIIEEADKYIPLVHELNKRSIESYIPVERLKKFDASESFLRKCRALETLTIDQRNHYHMKKGFRFDTTTTPTKDRYMGSSEISKEEKDLFSSIPDENWVLLMDGFGKRVASIFNDIKHRPNANDPQLNSSLDKQELSKLFKEIYSRI
jgi:hypothetical protein